MALLAGGVAVGWLASGRQPPRRNDDLAAVRVEIEALERAVAARPRAIPSPALVQPCAPAPLESQAAAAEPPPDAPDPEVVAQAESLVREAVAGRVWTETHRDRWMALSGQLDRDTRDRLGDALAQASLRLEIGEGLPF